MDSSDSEMQTGSYVKPQLSIKKYCKKINEKQLSLYDNTSIKTKTTVNCAGSTTY